jgi:carbamoyl-phosphate synthase large subunit
MCNVAVTGLNAGDSPAPGVPVIRCLQAQQGHPVRMIGLAYDALESGALDRRMLSDVYLLPYARSGREILLERLSYIHSQVPIDAVIPCLDAELPNFIRIRDDLDALGIHTLLPSEDQFRRRSKEHLGTFCADIGVKTPRTRHITDPARLGLREEGLPVMVKGLYYEAYLAHTVDEAAQYVHKVAARWGYPVLVQEYIEGEEFNAATVGDGAGKTLGVAGMKKLVFTDKGKGWACVSIENAALTALAERIVAALKWPGAMEVEAIQSRADGEFYLIELNPRFPAWIYLAAAAGMNLPLLYLRLALKEAVRPLTTYTPGVVFTNYTTNLITDLAHISPLFTDGELRYEEVL